ncbi:MAG: head GIN domain-containing protein [Bacteroidota bacterium]
MKATKIIALLIMAVSVTACHFDFNIGQVDGNGNVTTEERSVSSEFDEVKGNAGVDVYLTEGDEYKIVVEADENLVPLIETNISDGRLNIRTTENIGRSKAKKVHVTYKKLTGIYATSGADVISNSVIKSEVLNLESNSGADLELDINAKEVYAETSSGADMKLSGRAQRLTASASSGSDLKARDLEVKYCKANASSGADVTVNVLEEIEGKASSGGDVRYYGDPTAVSVKDGPSGSVRKM